MSDIVEGTDGRRFRLLQALVARNPSYNTHICEAEDQPGRELLMFVAPGDEQQLHKGAYIMNKLAEVSAQIDKDAAEQGEEGYSLELLFPEVIDSFLLTHQGYRQAIVVGARGIPDASDLLPISNIVGVDRRRAALGSSAWVLGRLAKLFTLTEHAGVSINNINVSSVLIEQEEHRMVLIDFTEAVLDPSNVEVKKDMQAAAMVVLRLIDYDFEKDEYPHPMPEGGEQYIELLKRLRDRKFRSAHAFHGELYRVIEAVFGPNFEPFRTYRL